jgi:hypothetical protein
MLIPHHPRRLAKEVTATRLAWAFLIIITLCGIARI